VILPKYTRNFQSLPLRANSDLIKMSDIVFLSPDFQFVDHPAYDSDRGPLFILGLRAHIEF
jgi:hypothetical protein